MKTYGYNESLLEMVKQKLPAGLSLAGFLTDVLCIGREAVYRRLRGEVTFTLEEAGRISRALDISIDRVLGAGSEKTSTYRMCMAEFENPSEADYRILEEYVRLIGSAADDPSSRLCVSANMFPQQVYLQYENLTRFFLFKKSYHDTGWQAKAFHRTLIPGRMRQVFRDSFEAHRRFKSLYFVFDKQILSYLVDNIRYFYSIGLLSRQDIALLREDILRMISYLEKIAVSGGYDNGSRVGLYISNISFDKNCYNIKIGGQYISIIEAYILNGVASTEKADYDRMEEWILSRIRFSTMISLCGEPQRIAFFNRQRSLLETLDDAPGAKTQ